MLALLALALPDAASAGVEIVDDAGRAVRLERPARRIIALYGAFNEILGEMGLADRIVARTRADVSPPCILDKPAIGTHMRPNLEMVAGLAPDLVLQMGGRRKAAQTVAQLERLGVTCALFDVRSVEDLFSVIQRVGVLTGARDRARDMVGSMDERLRSVSESLPKGKRPLVVYEIRYPNLLVAGRGSIVSDVIRLAGGENPVDSDKKIVRLNEEELIRLDPDYYVLQKGPMNKDPSAPGARPHYRTMEAVGAGRVLMVDEALFSRPGPRIVDAVERLARFIHPKPDEKD